MAITILHAEPFRTDLAAEGTRYVAVTWGSVVNAFAWDTSVGRAQWGRGTAPQGWALGGGGAPNHSFFGIRTTDMWTPTAPNAGNIAECFAYSRGGDGAAMILAEYGSIDGLSKHLAITVNGSGNIVATNGDGTVLGTSTYTMPLGTSGAGASYTHIEIIPYLDATNGWVKVYANGVLVLGLQNKNTTKGSASTPTIGILQRFLPLAHLMTDWVIHNAGGHGASFASAERQGDVRCEMFAPTVAGSRTAGTATGAATKLLAVNDLEHANDQNNTFSVDDTYVTLDDTSLPKGLSFTTAALPSYARTVLAVMPFALARKDTAGANTGRLLLKSASTETDGVSDGLTDLAPTTGYTPYARVAMVNPATSAAWTIAAANAAEIGYERIT